MKCFTCHTEMICYDDVNEESVRIDYVKCPKCGTVYMCNGHIELIEITGEELSGCLVEPEQDFDNP